jgi:hypothetical protein
MESCIQSIKKNNTFLEREKESHLAQPGYNFHISAKNLSAKENDKKQLIMHFYNRQK